MSSEIVTFPDPAEMRETACIECGSKVFMPAAVLAMFPRQLCDACEARKRGEVPTKDKPLTPRETLEKAWADGEDGICPRRFRDTEVDRLRKLWGGHKVEAVLGWKRTSSKGLIFRGSTGCGKTRLMLELFRACHFEGMSVRVLWPEDLLDAAVRAVREGEMGPTIRRLCAPQLLGLDDAFIAGASDERTQRFLLALADARYRSCRPLFLTSQVTGTEYSKAADKWGDLGPAGVKRLDALYRRLGAVCGTVCPQSEEPPLVDDPRTGGHGHE